MGLRCMLERRSGAGSRSEEMEIVCGRVGRCAAVVDGICGTPLVFLVLFRRSLGGWCLFCCQEAKKGLAGKCFQLYGVGGMISLEFWVGVSRCNPLLTASLIDILWLFSRTSQSKSEHS